MSEQAGCVGVRLLLEEMESLGIEPLNERQRDAVRLAIEGTVAGAVKGFADAIREHIPRN